MEIKKIEAQSLQQKAQQLTHLLDQQVDLRLGQRWWNAIRQLWPEVEPLRTTAVDPFYDDSRLHDFWLACFDDEAMQLFWQAPLQRHTY